MKKVTIDGKKYTAKFDHNHFSAPTLSVATIRSGSDGHGKIVAEAVVRKHVKDASNIVMAEKFALDKAFTLYEETHQDYEQIFRKVFMVAYNEATQITAHLV